MCRSQFNIHLDIHTIIYVVKVCALFLEPPKLVVNEKRYGRRSRPETSYSEDLYSADDESMIDSRPESRLSDSHFTTEADRVDSPVTEVRTQ